MIMGLKEKLTNWDERGATGRVLWVVFFIYSALMATFIQLVLPYLIPQFHLGHGLFVLDSTGFHEAAANQAAKMMEKGWSTWQLRPEGHYPGGVASIFYYLWDPEPYSFIPFSAALHATAGHLVYFLLSSFMQNRWTAASGAAFFVLNPASMEWVAQIHRDGTFIVGVLMVLAAWLMLFKTVKANKWQGFLSSFLVNGLGLFCILIARPYWIQVALVACLILYMIILLSWTPFLLRNYLHAPHHIAAVFLGCLMLILQFLLVQEIYSAPSPSPSMEASHRRSVGLSIEEQFLQRQTMPGQDFQAKEWVNSPFIPKFIETKLYGLSSVRKALSSLGGNTLIDPEAQLISTGSYLMYFPRAVQIGLLSPFPSLWTGTGSTPAMTLARNIMGIVTCFSYVCLVFFIWSLWANRKSMELWLIVLYSTFGLVVFTYAYCNIGTLLRLRYGFFMMITGIGFAFAVQKLIESRQKNTNAVIKKGS